MELCLFTEPQEGASYDQLLRLAQACERAGLTGFFRSDHIMLIGQRRSIVGDEPGITRDRIYGEVEWSGQRFSIVDTGGIVPDDDAIIPANIFKQAGFAIDDAEALIWVVDARQGLTPLDEELAWPSCA